MQKLNLENLKEQKIDNTEMKMVNGGSMGYNDYYCKYVNPKAWFCQ